MNIIAEAIIEPVLWFGAVSLYFGGAAMIYKAFEYYDRRKKAHEAVKDKRRRALEALDNDIRFRNIQREVSGAQMCVQSCENKHPLQTVIVKGVFAEKLYY